LRASRPATGQIASCGALAAFLLCIACTGGGVGWFDAPELAAASQQLGVAHAPGEPAYLLLARLVQLAPVGDLAFRCVVLSAAICALLVAVTVGLAREILPTGSPRALITVSLGLAFCGPLWVQGIVVELYGLQVLLLMTSLWVVLRARGTAGAWLVAGGIFGLSVAVNPLLAALALPGALIVLLAGAPPRRMWTLAASALVASLVAGSCYTYLLLRSAADTGVRFAAIDDLASWIGFISGKTYARSFGVEGGAGWLANLLQHLRLMLSWVGVPACAVALFGAIRGIGARPRLYVGLIVLGGGTWLTTLSRPTLETFTPDVAGYFLGSCVVAVVLAGVGLEWLEWRSARAANVALAITVAWMSVCGLASIESHRNRHGEAVALAILEAVPPGGVLVKGSDSTSLPVLYATTVGRRRPDTLAVPVYATTGALLQRQLLRYPWIAEPPEVRAGVEAESLVRALLRDNPGYGVVGTPLLWPPELTDRLVPAGLAVAVQVHEGSEPRERHQRLYERLVRPLWGTEPLRRDRQLRRLLAATASAQAGVALRRGNHAWALDILREASSLHPDPWSMVHLQRASVEDGTLVKPTPSDHLEDEAATLFWAGDLDGAGRAWAEALRLSPASPAALAGRERLYSLGKL